MPERRIIIIAGPNGAGKTTFAREYLPLELGIKAFINADLIAAGLSPFAPELVARRAGRLMLEEIDRCSARGISFGFETTLSGKAYAQRIGDWQAWGYSVKLIFLSLPSVEQAVTRVQLRVRQGGHAIPAEVIARRFKAGLHNLETLYKPLVDEWQMIDNGGAVPQFLSEGGRP
ncbi:MAG: zeta toxin family protein [Cyanobium sp. CZS 48M]|nr:zeta toxin family protein [Cyanobium sp. CZS48M]